MKKIYKIASLTLALGMGLSLLAGCATNNGWLNGEGVPAADLGKNGDLYLDKSTWDVYTKENDVWTAQGNIQGGQGDQGDKGDKGDAGEAGNGWLNGEGAPSAELGKDGDMYVDNTTWDVYAKENGEWKYRDTLNEGAAEDADLFKKMTLTDGPLQVLPATEFLSDKAKHLFAASVQGIFAQIGESKYYLNCGGHDETRLDEIKTKYHKDTEETTLEAMCADYQTRFSNGYVLYDANDFDSLNCARTIAGARQLVMVDKTMTAWAEQHELELKIDATEMTAEACFDTYHDELDNSGVIQERGYRYTDYAIACRYFCYYPIGDENTNGSPEHPLPPQDKYTSVREKVLSWSDGGLVFGDFPLGEYGTVKVNSFYNHPTVVGTGSANVTVTSCIDSFGRDKYVQPNKPTDKTLDVEDYPLNKHYVTIINGDGDNVGCWFEGTFDQPQYMGGARSDFPIGWEINPSLAALAPTILDGIYANAKKEDTFVCSIAGFGHTFLRYFTDKALKRYTGQLNRYIEKCDFSIVKILDDGSINDEDRVIEAFSKMDNAEGFYYCTYGGAYKDDHGAVRWSENGKPVVSCRYTLWDNFGDPEDIAASINASPADATKIDGYSYVNLHLWSKDYSDVETMVSLLNEKNITVVDPITFIRLIKKNVPQVNAAPEK